MLCSILFFCFAAAHFWFPSILSQNWVWNLWCKSFWESCSFLYPQGKKQMTQRNCCVDTFLTWMTKTEFRLFLCSVELPVGHYVLLTVFTRFSFFHQQVSTGHIIIPSSLLWLQSEFLLMTAVALLCSGSQPALSTFHWWTRTAICLNKLIPAVRLNLWKTHHCDNFRHVWLFRQIFRDVPSCNLCYLSQNKNRIKLTYVSTPLDDGSQITCELFLFRQVTLSSAETCQEMNSRVIQALNVLQMTPS